MLGLEQCCLTAPVDIPLRIVVGLIAAALHAAWILPAIGRHSPGLIGLAWVVSVWICRAGLVAAGFTEAILPATVLEAIILTLALSAHEGTPLGRSTGPLAARARTSPRCFG